MLSSGVYAIVNLENGKTYIGSTINFENRWGQHKRALSCGVHDNSHLQRSWDKYGPETFEFGVLEYLDNLDELVLAEQFWMDIYHEEGRELYNIALVAGAPMLGRKHSDETKQQMSESHKGILKGYKHSAEFRQRMSEAKSGEGNSMYGKHHTQESKDKMGVRKGQKHSKETRCKISRGVKAYWARVREQNIT